MSDTIEHGIEQLHASHFETDSDQLNELHQSRSNWIHTRLFATTSTADILSLKSPYISRYVIF